MSGYPGKDHPYQSANQTNAPPSGQQQGQRQQQLHMQQQQFNMMEQHSLHMQQLLHPQQQQQAHPLHVQQQQQQQQRHPPQQQAVYQQPLPSHQASGASNPPGQLVHQNPQQQGYQGHTQQGNYPVQYFGE